MKIRIDQIQQHLKQGLKAIYFVSGDEPLQVMESTDTIRNAARQLDYTEREVMDVDSHFDWNQLLDAGNSLSLFAEKRIIELRMPSGKPGKQGSQVLIEYAQRPAEDAVLIITAGKLDSSAKNTKWFKALDQLGVVIQCWPISVQELPRWIEQRMRQKNLKPTTEAVSLLADRIEGNMLAAAQEIDKLYLLYGDAVIGIEEIASAVADSARYNIYDLVDSALTGDVVRAARISSGLKNEGIEPVLALWALSREVRLLAGFSESNISMDAAMTQARIWDSRKPLLKKALNRHGARRWRGFLRRCARIDRVIKGIEPGRPWDELLALTTQIAQTR
ncbi:MAG: DNA polymerase III subunit delta [Gammaproteobacteria bacterium]|nr:DNA polymerase III subunit delta [Gammaproteobacteria bacterium]